MDSCISMTNVRMALFGIWGLALALAAEGRPPAGSEAGSEPCPQVVPAEARSAAEERLREEAGDLLVGLQDRFSVPKSLYNPTGFLSKKSSGEAREIALGFVREHLEVLGLIPADLEEMELADSFRSKASGISHFYFRQRHAGLELHNGQLQIHVDREGRVLGVSSTFVPALAERAGSPEPELEAAEAVRRARLDLGLESERPPKVIAGPEGKGQRTELEAEGISKLPVSAHLTWFSPTSSCRPRLAWSFTLEPLDGHHLYDQLVDAATGEVLWRQDRILRDVYSALPQPAGSPDRAAWAPVVDPADPTASPFGWHDIDGSPGAEFTNLRGNNAHSFLDPGGTDAPPAIETTCDAGQICVFPLDLTQPPASNSNAALVNAFYWTNVAHDLAALYGFDEAAGNFQFLNLSGDGLGGDDIEVHVQDSFALSPHNNAYFRSQPEGTSPTMTLPVWSCPTCTPALRDSALDNGIIVHEYAHGISQRLVGGASTVSCLGRAQQAGEGISDFYALALTHEPGLDGDEPRGLGTYLLGERSDGPGIRIEHYSSDPSINRATYETLRSRSGAHDVGEVWAQALWEAYWALIDRHGFDPDLYRGGGLGRAGNQRMLRYVTEGLALTACDPTFADLRDGILQAAQASGGEDVCLLWNVFADFGLGIDADDAGADSTNVRNGFAPASECRCTASPPELISWWAMDHPETDLAYDQADLDLGNHGRLQGDPRPGRGLVGPGLVFDGDDAVEAFGGDDFDGFEETGFTVEGWILPERRPAPGRRQAIWHFGTSGLGRSISLFHDAEGRLTVTFLDQGSTRSFSTAPGAIEPGRWFHVAATFLGPPHENTIWVDGRELARDLGSFRLFRDRNVLRLGGDGSLPSPHLFQGRMDEMAIYRRARSRAEIRSIALAGAAGRCKTYCGRPKTAFERVVQVYESSGRVDGGSGPDLFFGSPGADEIHGDNGRDCIFGFGGDDELFGKRDRDTLFGGFGDDTLEGDEDDDEVFGGHGEDTIRGRRGSDILHGGPHDDFIEGNDGDDRIFGEGGDDTLLGRRGGDTIFGGVGADTLEGDDGDDTLDGGRGRDLLLGGNGVDHLIGGRGRDRLHGGSRGDTLEGGRGFDFLSGGDGADILRGEDGNDRLCGGPGGDTLEGGLGTDQFRGGSGSDTEIEVETEIPAASCNQDAFDAW